MYRCLADNNVRPPSLHDATLTVFFQPTARPVQSSYGQAENRMFDITIECRIAGKSRMEHWSGDFPVQYSMPCSQDGQSLTCSGTRYLAVEHGPLSTMMTSTPSTSSSIMQIFWSQMNAGFRWLFGQCRPMTMVTTSAEDAMTLVVDMELSSSLVRAILSRIQSRCNFEPTDYSIHGLFSSTFSYKWMSRTKLSSRTRCPWSCTFTALTVSMDHTVNVIITHLLLFLCQLKHATCYLSEYSMAFV